MAQFDLDIDHRIVSVVQIPDDSVDVATTPRPRRRSPQEPAGPAPGAHGHLDHEVRGETVVDVTMTIGREVTTGRAASAQAAPAHRPRIIATATLAALTELLGIPASVEARRCWRWGCAGRRHHPRSPSPPRRPGPVRSALVRGDGEDAIARSVLAAVNRRLAG